MHDIDDHGDSTAIAVAIVKAEEGGLVDEVTLDAMWETQIERADKEEIAEELVWDLVDKVANTLPKYMQVRPSHCAAPLPRCPAAAAAAAAAAALSLSLSLSGPSALVAALSP